ncbi:MAG: NYN domain-containing protein [Myxococcota bacterium]
MRIPERFVGAQQLSVDTTDDLGAVAVFFDFENIVLGVRDEFRVSTVIDALNERGDVMVRRAYADWGRYRRYQRQFLEQGVAMVFLPSYGIGDKNRTDTAICVDAMEILFTRPHIDTFVIASGDSDFGVLAHRLRDHGKRVVGISAKSAASDILVKICHEFIFYESLVGQRVQGVSMEEAEERVRRAVQVCVDQHGPRFRASVIKDRMRKQDPTFSERNYGASSFTRFLRNFDHLVELLDGGMVQVTGASASPNGGPQSRQVEATPAKPPVLAPEIEAEAAEHVRRAILLASPDGEPVSLARLKDALGEVAPDFDEMALGFRTFTRFLKTFPTVVEVERDRNRVRAVVDERRGGDKPAPAAKSSQGRPPETRPSQREQGPDEADAEAPVAKAKQSDAKPAEAKPAAEARPPKGADAAPDEAPKPSRSRAQRRNARGSVKPLVPVAEKAAAPAVEAKAPPKEAAKAEAKPPQQPQADDAKPAEKKAPAAEAKASPAEEKPKGGRRGRSSKSASKAKAPEKAKPAAKSATDDTAKASAGKDAKASAKPKAKPAAEAKAKPSAKADDGKAAKAAPSRARRKRPAADSAKD